jgi:putative transposase
VLVQVDEAAAAGPVRPALGADIIQQRTGEGWLYVAVMLDAFSRRIVGWSMADHLHNELVLDALDMAIAQRQPAAG